MATGATTDEWVTWLGCGEVEGYTPPADQLSLVLGNPALPIYDLAWRFADDDDDTNCLSLVVEVAQPETLAAFLGNPMLPYWLLAHADDWLVIEPLLKAFVRIPYLYLPADLLRHVFQDPGFRVSDTSVRWSAEQVVVQKSTLSYVDRLLVGLRVLEERSRDTTLSSDERERLREASRLLEPLRANLLAE